MSKCEGRCLPPAWYTTEGFEVIGHTHLADGRILYCVRDYGEYFVEAHLFRNGHSTYASVEGFGGVLHDRGIALSLYRILAEQWGGE